MKICMLAYTFYERDGRVIRYAETLAARGDRVDVVALRRDGQARTEVINGVNVFRIQVRRVNERHQLAYLFRILLFMVRAAVFVLRRHLQSRYDLLHVHSVPDFLVLAALPARVIGRPKVILDVHDLLPELYSSKFSGQSQSPAFRLLVAIERASALLADHVIVANHLWEERYRERIKAARKTTAILNCPDRALFRRSGPKTQNGAFRIVYPGTLNWHQGVDLAVKACARLADDLPNLEFDIYGEGPCKQSISELVTTLGIQDRVRLHPFLPITQIVSVMESADLAVVPKRSDSFGGEAFSTKILEFMCLDVPVIVANTRIDRHYFNDSQVMFFQAGDDQDLARCIRRMVDNGPLRQRLCQNARSFAEANDWERNKATYLEVVDGLACQA